ncbi:metallophosphoesterase [Burkholderia gladioli]|uniref:metallophosphoesterase n=1 Tax=Burkholderia gladioli TaxID=28095 RepID=UPI0016409ECB|nr:metallophosphoesterase [Burkholderia gladioli]
MLLLHLSDIHFRKRDIETAQDPNFNLRNEIVRDARDFCRKLGPPDAIILSGDVAFAADPDEYGFATNWLGELCAACGVDLSTIFVCPGNHDVVRRIADKTIVQMLHKSIKSSDEIATDATIQGLLMDPETSRLLYESLDNYNAFAGQFLCDLLPPNRTRIHRDLELNDGSTLRLWAINTCFVSSSGDKEGDLFVDPAALQITRHDGVENVVIAHHHLSWIRQKRALEDHLNDVARIQIFGHVHTNRVHMLRDYVRLSASAAHPDRHEGNWEPGYNLIEVAVEGAGGDRTLLVRTHVRVWQTAPGGFHAKMDKNRDVFEHRIQLDSWTRPQVTASPKEAHPGDRSSGNPDQPSAETMTKIREIGVQFYRLTFSQKSEIAGRLQLLEEQDINQPDFERFRRVFLRAHERGKLDELANAVANAAKI